MVKYEFFLRLLKTVHLDLLNMYNIPKTQFFIIIYPTPSNVFEQKT